MAQEELSAWLMQQSQRYGMTAEQFANELVKGGQVQMAVTEVRRAKALALVLERGTIVDPSGNPVDLEALNSDLAEAMAAGQMGGLGA